MPFPQKKHFTIDDIYALPDGQRAELINGQLYNMAPPLRIHQELIMELSATIWQHVKAKNGSCKVYPAPFAVNLNADDKIYVEPDISVICDPGKLTDKGCKGAPDLVIEVVSPSSRRMDCSTKNTLYFDAGVREYWIVDPEKSRTTVYRYEEDAAPTITPFDSPINSGIYRDLHIHIADLLK